MNKLLLIFCIQIQVGYAQDGKIDSLRRTLADAEQRPAGYVRDTLRCRAVRLLMRTYLDINIDSSMYYSEQLIRLCQTPRLLPELTYAYQFMGHLHRVRGDYHESIRYQYKALSLAEKQQQHARIARSYSALGLAYTSLKDYAKAAQMCERALAVLHKHPDPTLHLATLNAFAGLYREQRKPAEALRVNEEMYALARREHILWHEAQGLHSIGWDHMLLGDLDKPQPYYQQALAIARSIGATDLEQSILLHLAELDQRRGNWANAITYCQQAKQLAVRQKNSSIIVEAEEKLYQLYKANGKPTQALTAYEAMVALRDSLSKERTEQRIEALQAQYDNARKTSELRQNKTELLTEQNRNQQLAITRNGLLVGVGVVVLVAMLLYGNLRRLQAKNREIDRQRVLLETARSQLAEANATLETRVTERTEALVQANRELTQKNEDIKAALFKGQTIERKRVALELHDNLSSLLSAVNMSMQAINPKHLSESEQGIYRSVKQMVQNAYAEVRNISHNILPAELEKDGLVATLTTLIDRLNQHTQTRFTLTATNVVERLPNEIEFNVYSIVLELLNNAIKHAQASAVAVELTRTETGVEVAVADDGVGFGGQQSQRGVGLQNIQTRLDSLGGTFEAPPTARGTSVHIKIPIEAVAVDGNVD